MAEKKRTGTYRKDQEPERPVDPVVMIEPAECPAPAHLTSDQQKAWDEIVNAVIHLGTLSKADLLHMEAAAIQMALLRELDSLWRDLPPFDDEGAVDQSRLRIGKDITAAVGRVQNMLGLLGLNPSSRGKLEKPDVTAPTKMANLIGGMSDK